MVTTKKQKLKHFDGIYISIPILETCTNKPLIVLDYDEKKWRMYRTETPEWETFRFFPKKEKED